MPASLHNKSVLIVSKPLIPPWNDSSKNLAMGVVTHTPEIGFHVFTTPEFSFPAPHIVSEPLYRSPGLFAPSLKQNFRVLLRLCRPDREIDIYHFFFAPNPLTSTVARWITRFKRQVTIQTICSPPASYENLPRLIFTDIVVVLSDHHLNIFRRAGIRNVVKINPGVNIPDNTKLSHNKLRKDLGLPDEKIVLYPGDYEYSGGHEVILEILPRIVKEFPGIRLIFACRPKTPRSSQLEIEIKTMLRNRRLEKYIIFLPKVENMDELYDLTSVCLFPAKSLNKKMDLPLTLLECLAWKIPVIIGNVPPVNELMREKVGMVVKPDSPREVMAAVRTLLSNDQLRYECGNKGRILAQSDFDIRKIAARYEELYRQCYQGGRK